MFAKFCPGLVNNNFISNSTKTKLKNKEFFLLFSQQVTEKNKFISPRCESRCKKPILYIIIYYYYVIDSLPVFAMICGQPRFKSTPSHSGSTNWAALANISGSLAQN